MPGGGTAGATWTPPEVREALRGAYPRVEQRHGTVVTLLGAAETGKSRLVADVARDARDRRWTVLLATGTPRSSEVPRGIVLEALRPILPSVSPAQGPTVNKPSEPAGLGLPLALAAFLPAVSQEESAAPLSGQAAAAPWELPSSLSPAEAEQLLLRRLWEAAHRAPVLLLLDDVQWMDELSQRFLSTLCLTIREHRVLLLLALDPEAAPPLVRRFAIQEEGGLSTRVFRITPASTHRPRPLPPQPPPAPETVEPSLLESLLSLGAVVGIEFDARTLSEVTGRPVHEVLENLEDGARRGWLWKTGEATYHFSGERTWKWALEMPYEDLRTRHGRVAKALEALNPKPEGRVLFELAHHWSEAGDTAKALPYLVRSAEAAYGAGAYQVAQDRLQRSLGMLTGLPEVQRGQEEVHVLMVLAQVLDAMGEGTKAGARLREALTRAERLHLPVRDTVRIEVLLGDLHRRWGHGEQALEILERARARAEAAQDAATEATVLSRIAMVQRRQGKWDDARHNVERALVLLETGKGGPEEKALVHFAAADTFVWGGPADTRAAEEHIRKTREALQELGQTSREVPLMNLEGLHASQLGDTAEALRLWKQAADTAIRLGNLNDAANMHGNLAEVYAEERRFTEAQSSINIASELAQGMEEPRLTGQIYLAAATLAWKQGNTARAEQEIDRGLAVLATDAGVDLRQQLEFLRARIRLAEGKLEEARKLTEHLDPVRYPKLLPPVHQKDWARMFPG